MLKVGIDYSITSPAIFVGEEGCDFSDGYVFCFGRNKIQGKIDNIQIDQYPDWSTQEERHKKLSDWAFDALTFLGKPEKVILEGYSYGSKGKIFNLAENTGLLKQTLFQSEIPFEIPSPQTVKKFATGKGNSDKMQMWNAFWEETRYPLRKNLDCESEKNLKEPVPDIVDAFWMHRFES